MGLFHGSEGNKQPHYDGEPELTEDERVKRGTRGEDGQPRDMFFKEHGTNPFIAAEDDRFATFAADVDTGSYTVMREYLNRGILPPESAVRVEEFVNYFDYGYAPPRERGKAFALHLEAAPSRYGKNLKNAYLLRVGIQGRKIDDEERKPAVLTFVIDISGSMATENRLGLVKRALKLLVRELKEDDKVGIAVYGSRGYKHLSHTRATNRDEILEAIDELESSGSTNAEEGIRIGYEMAEKAFREGAINRVILCSDGVANVGRTGPEEILKEIEEQRRQGITLSAIGFGMSNYNDTLMEQLGDKGDGHYAYVDDIDEARRVFVENLTGTLQVIARDVKIQVEFNPKVVKSYRLLGYENRDVADKDFRNDKVDGGEVGSGHSVTALFEVKLHADSSGDICTATVRYKHDEREKFIELDEALTTRELASDWDDASESFRLAGNVAEFAEIMRGSYWARGSTLEDVRSQVKKLAGDDERLRELRKLIEKAERLIDDKREPAAAGGH